VSIDELGRVINATAESGTGNTHSELTKAALEAARKWLFAPAVLHGKKIPSGQTILFEFRPSRR
jgi:TonB family protein